MYGSTADVPYCRKAHLGTLIEDDVLNRTKRLDFKLYKAVAGAGSATVSPCLVPSATVFAGNYSFTLVFFPTKVPPPERPIQPYYDFHKLYLSTENRASFATTTPTDCVIPIKYTTHGAMENFGSRWCVAVEFVSPLRLEYAALGDLPQAVYLTSNTFTQSGTNNTRHLCALGRTFRTLELACYGQRYSVMPASRDAIGMEVGVPLENLSSIHLRLEDAAGVKIDDLRLVRDFLVCLAFYRVK